MLRVLLAYAVSLDMIACNPAISVKKYRGRSDGFHSWSEEEIAQVRARHPVGSDVPGWHSRCCYIRRSDVAT